jgi:proline iminopeptidase
MTAERRTHPVNIASLLAAAALTACASTECPSARFVLAKSASGFVNVEGGNVAYWVRGSGTHTPLLVLHGGPGIPHDYLENLALLGDERPVVFYDQLGCGKSDRPDDPKLWTRERFAREVDAVRRELGLDEVILYGHSWGTILAVDYLSGAYLTGAGGARPAGVRGVILAGPALSIPRWHDDSRRLIATLPEPMSSAILEGERTGRTDTKAYHEATETFYKRYICRREPWPAGLNRAFEGLGKEVYGTMNGPTEFTVTGTLKSVDVTPRLGGLGVPALYICGEHDEATPESTRAYAALTPNSELVVIAGAAHVANFDRPVEYMAALRAWMAGR